MSDDLSALLARAWAPGAVDPAAFDAGVRRRARRLHRGRMVLTAALVAALAGFGVRQVALRAPTPPAAAPVAQVAASDAWWSEAVDPAARTYALPGTYSALDSLFLQPFDQEL